MTSDAVIHLGDCRAVLPTLPAASFDAVISDPPYPFVSRDYGRWGWDDWFELMRAVVAESRRLLTPAGSALFVLQPNSDGLGSMRPWLWDFLSWCCREWNVVQDLWWWNTSAIPEAQAIQGRLTRPSVKALVWLGPRDCYRDQRAVLWTVSQAHVERSAAARAGRRNQPSGHGCDEERMGSRWKEAGGVLPFNVLPFGGGKAAGMAGHSAGTPLELCRWLVRFLCPRGGVVLDPFSGTASVGVAALHEERRYVGVERDPAAHAAALARVAKEVAVAPLFTSSEEVRHDA